MKYLLCILDGASDRPVPELGKRTPLEAACTPFLDAVARRGVTGRMRTTCDGLPVESLACIMGIFGYNPLEYYPQGRAAAEALALGIPVYDCDLTLRCNIVELSDKGLLESATPAHISDAQAQTMLSRIELPDSTWELHAGKSYRNVLVIRGILDDIPELASSLCCSAPHMHLGQAVSGLLPTGCSGAAKQVAHKLAAFMAASGSRDDAEERPCGPSTMLWVWSPSLPLRIPAFQARYGQSGAVITGTDVVKGLALAAGMQSREIPGATGYTDTDYRAKAASAALATAQYDFVCVHVNSPDEAGHQRSPQGKVKALEEVDRNIIGPLLEHLEARYPGDFSMAVCIDHGTSSLDGKHLSEPTPWLMYPSVGTSCAGETAAIPFSNVQGLSAFCEAAVIDKPVTGALDFMRMLLADTSR